MGLFAKIVDGFKPLTILAKRLILDVQLGFEYAVAFCSIPKKCLILEEI